MVIKYLSNLPSNTVVSGPAQFPFSTLLSELLPSDTVCLNIAPKTNLSYLKQIDGFERCILQGTPLDSLIPDNTTTLLLNNISFWILYSGIHAVYEALLRLSKKYKVVSVLLQGTLDPDIEETLLLLPDNIITLTPGEGDVHTGTCTGCVRLPTGKTDVYRDEYTIRQDKIKITKRKEKTVQHEETKTCDVTFELGLSAGEKSARAATHLPYTAASQQDSLGSTRDVTTTTSDDTTGQIHYIPDETDDWDDEDPDDDLDV